MSKTTERVKTLREKVIILLTKYPELQDCDKKLVTKMWYFELKKYGVDPVTITASQFFELYQENLLTNSDVITRARRKVQEEIPELRGTKWEERHEEATDTRFDISK